MVTSEAKHSEIRFWKRKVFGGLVLEKIDKSQLELDFSSLIGAKKNEKKNLVVPKKTFVEVLLGSYEDGRF